MTKVKLLMCVLQLVVLSSVCFADRYDELEKENNALQKRVKSLENEMAQIRQMLAGKMQAAKVVEKAAPVQLSQQQLKELASMVRKSPDGKSPVLSGLDAEIYGYIKFDAAYDSSRTTPGNYVKWVDSEASNKDDDEFNATANQTRLGFRVSGPYENGIRTSGRAEIDFYGGGSENKAQMMMRHVYMKLDWPEEQFSIIAGQTSDIISPLVPYTLNYSVQWWSGNIGYRRPQLRLTKGFSLDSDVDLLFQAALTRTIGDSSFMGSAITETGEDSGKPTFQGRVGLTWPLLAYKPTTIGFSGHWGEEEFDTSVSGSHEDVESWSINFDLNQPINECFSIKGELYAGENMDAYLGGIGQGINSATGNAISSKGGWVAAAIGPFDKFRFNVGIGIDDVDAKDVNAGDRTLNRSLFGNVVYSLNKSTDVGFELTQWDTKRKNERDADDLRAQMSLIYKF